MNRVLALFLAVLFGCGGEDGCSSFGQGKFGRGPAFRRRANGGAPAPIPELPAPVAGEYNQIQQRGQSLSTGLAGGPAITTTSLNATVLNRGVTDPLCQSVEGTTSTPPTACGVTGNDLETGMVAMGDTIVAHGSTRNWVLGNTGCNGAAAAAIMKGGTSPACYNNSFEPGGHVATTNAAVSPALHRAAASVLIHGEGDEGPTSFETYRDFLIDDQANAEADVIELTGQTFRMPLFLNQQHCWNECNSTATSVIVLAQLAASEADPNRIVLCGPKYHMDYADGTHLLNTSYRRQGEELGRCIYIVEELGINPYPMVPTITLADEDTIELDYTGRVPCTAAGDCGVDPLEFDTTLVAAHTNNGFEYDCPPDTNEAASISSTSITGAVVTVELNAPHIIGCQIGYAYTGTPDAPSGASEPTNSGGNLRDTTTTVGPRSGDELYAWAPTFLKDVPGGIPEPPRFSERAATFNGTDESITCADISTLDSSEGTICVWLYTTNWGVTYRSAVSKYNFGTQNTFEIARITGAELRMYATDPANGTQLLVSNNDFGVNSTWIFSCMTLGAGATNADRLQQYRNGALNTGVTYTGTLGSVFPASTSPLRIGSYTGAISFWEGRLDDIAIWNERVSAGCITTFYNSGQPRNLMSVTTGCPQPDHYITFEAQNAADTGTLGTAACSTLTNMDASNFPTGLTP